MEKVKWLHFYTSGSNQTDTFYMELMKFQANTQEHQYRDAEDMLSKNTKDTFNFWDGVPVGLGKS